METIAHRGAKLELPENSVAAFRRAFERGADAIELDVHGTRDGLLVVHHDALVRIPGSARRQRIADLEATDLAKIELAPGVTIPTLEDVLGAAPTGKSIYVEIKGTGISALVASVVERDARCAVHSFDYATVARMRDLVPRVPRGILFEQRIPDIKAAMSLTGARDVWPHWRLIDHALVDQVHDAGGRVIAWTVNDAQQARILGGMGVDGICSDDMRLLDRAR